MTNLVKTACLIASLTCVSSLALADIPAANYTGGGTSGNYPYATGFWFSLNHNVTVTGLGFYDLTGTGLAASHDVGIFKADGTLVVSAVVDAGTTDPFIAGTLGGTRVKSVAATLLTTGQDYYCIADNLSVDMYTYGSGAVTFAPELNWESYGDLTANNIFSGVPTKSGGIPGNLDGTFVYVVPEPASAALLVLGLLVLPRKGRR